MSYDIRQLLRHTELRGHGSVITTYRKELDEDDVPICTITCWADEAEGHGFHSPMAYDEGRYPFVCITREKP